MAMTVGRLRTGFQSAIRSFTSKMNFSSSSSSSSSHHDDAYEMAKWEKITYAGIATCTVLAIYNLSKGHPHYEEPPPYPYLHIRNKEFPWGPDGLFERKHKEGH